MQTVTPLGHHIVIIEKERKLVESLTAYVTKNRVKGGSITGLGALKHVELGYYELEKKDYIRKTFSTEDYELISLTGNLSLREGKPYVHVHASLGTSKFEVFGGHLFEAVVAVTTEVIIHPLGLMPERVFDSCLGLATIQKQAEP